MLLLRQSGRHLDEKTARLRPRHLRRRRQDEAGEGGGDGHGNEGVIVRLTGPREAARSERERVLVQGTAAVGLLVELSDETERPVLKTIQTCQEAWRVLPYKNLFAPH
jgi:hypothetical protein